jgi:peptidoglycan/LPS O-acetylase OafA/YrhL
MASPPAGRPQDYWGGLDLLRFVAAVSVMLAHYSFAGALAGRTAPVGLDAIDAWTRYGYLGVHLFFVISGFVIARTAFATAPMAFFASRFARVFPTFLLCVPATALILAWLRPELFRLGWIDVLANLTFFPQLLGRTYIDGVYWTLSYEVIFYTWVLVLMRGGLLYRRLEWLVAAWLLLAGLNQLVLHTRILKMLLVTDYAPLFAAGLLLHRLARQGSPWCWPLLGAAALLAGANEWMHVGAAAAFDARWAALGAALSPALVGLGVLLPATGSFRRTCYWLGGLSYPLYLLHNEPGYLAINTLQGRVSGPVAVALTASGMIIVAGLLFRLEDPWRPRFRRAILNAARSLPFTALQRTTGRPR